MIQHTMFVAFDEPIDDAELASYLHDIEQASLATGLVDAFASRRHLAVPGEDQIPALVATVVVRLEVADLDALAKAFAAPELHHVIEHWQARRSYRVGWANHEPWD